MQAQDTVTIDPSVLIAMVQNAAISVQGVAEIGTLPIDARRFRRGMAMGDGVALTIDGNSVAVELYLVFKSSAVMKKVSIEVQHAVKRTLEELVGMDVVRVNVHIENVDGGHKV